MRPNFPILKCVGGIWLLLLAGVAQADRFSVALDLDPVAVAASGNFSDVSGGAEATLSAVPGQPRLPRQIFTYALPPDADLATVAVTVDDLESAELPLARPVRPAPPWRTWYGP